MTVHCLGLLFNALLSSTDPDTTPFNKTFTAQLRTLDELERRLRFLTEEIKDAEVPVSGESCSLSVLC